MVPCPSNFSSVVSATISIGLARGDGAVFCFAPCVLEGAAAGNVLGQDRFVKKHGGDFQRWLRLGRKFDFFNGGSSKDGSFTVGGFGLPIDFKASWSWSSGSGPNHAKKAPTPCIRVGLVRLVLISVRPPNGQLARGSRSNQFIVSQHARCFFTGPQTFKCQKCHFAVSGGFVFVDAQLVFEVIEHGRVTTRFTSHRLAHGHNMSSHGFTWNSS